jgi:hypothetical protein
VGCDAGNAPDGCWFGRGGEELAAASWRLGPRVRAEPTAAQLSLTSGRHHTTFVNILPLSRNFRNNPTSKRGAQYPARTAGYSPN